MRFIKIVFLVSVFFISISLFLQKKGDFNKNIEIITNIVDEMSADLKGKCSVLVIFPPEYIDKKRTDAGDILVNRFINYFVKKSNKEKYFRVIERKELDKIYEEYIFQQTGFVDEKQVVEIGKMLGADCIFSATLRDLEDKKSEINSKIIKIETSEIISTSIDILNKEWTDKKIESDKLISKITFEPTPLKKVEFEFEEIKHIQTIDFTDTDIEVLKEYDKLYQMDLDENILPLEKSKLWYEFGKKYPKYLNLSKERGDWWVEYDKKLKEYEKYKKKREEALKKDWAKLKELLELKSIDVKQKTDWVFKFLDVYGWNKEENKFYSEVKTYLPVPCVNKKIGFCYYDGFIMVEGKYDYAGSFSEGLARVYLNDKWGYIDKSGREVIPLKYDDAWSFSEGLASVKLNGKYGFIDKSGREVIPLKYDNAWDFSKGLARVKLNSKWGYIDKSGREVIPLKYDYADFFSEGLARVYLNGKWGYIDKNGREVTPLKYDYAEFFSEGLARVELNGKSGVVDRFGREYFPLE